MCYLVTIGTREPEARVKALLDRESRLSVSPSDNRSLRSVFPARDRLFQVTNGHCSCDLILTDKKDKKNGSPRQEALCNWLRSLARVDGGVRVFVHWYSGRFDKESLSSSETIYVPVEQLVDPSVLGEDRLVDILAPPRRPPQRPKV